MATPTEFKRFLLEEVNAGQAAGWDLASGWFWTQQTAWAWFSREVSDGTPFGPEAGGSPSVLPHG